MVGQRQRAAVTHRNDVFDQLAKKLCPGPLLISGFRRPTGTNDFIQLQPMLHQPHPIHAEKSGESAGFVGDKKGFALRRERIFIAAFLE